MLPCGCKPDGMTYGILIGAYDKGNQWCLALQVLTALILIMLGCSADLTTLAYMAFWSQEVYCMESRCWDSEQIASSTQEAETSCELQGRHSFLDPGPW